MILTHSKPLAIPGLPHKIRWVHIGIKGTLQSTDAERWHWCWSNSEPKMQLERRSGLNNHPISPSHTIWVAQITQVHVTRMIRFPFKHTLDQQLLSSFKVFPPFFGYIPSIFFSKLSSYYFEKCFSKCLALAPSPQKCGTPKSIHQNPSKSGVWAPFPASARRCRRPRLNAFTNSWASAFPTLDRARRKDGILDVVWVPESCV